MDKLRQRLGVLMSAVVLAFVAVVFGAPGAANAWVNGEIYLISALHSGRCLDVARQSQDHAANVIQADCWAGYNQQWRIGRIGPGNDVELIGLVHAGLRPAAALPQTHDAILASFVDGYRMAEQPLPARQPRDTS